jgi:hypothetical protein
VPARGLSFGQTLSRTKGAVNSRFSRATFVHTGAAARRPGDGAGERAAALRGFVETLGRRLQKGQSSLNETLEDVEKKPLQGARDDGLGRASYYETILCVSVSTL